MGLIDGVSRLAGIVGFLVKLAFVGVITAVGWHLVPELVAAGELPRAPLGLAEMGLPATVFGIPAAYAGGILLLDALVLFGEGGGSGAGGHVGDDGFGDGGGGFGGGDGGGDGGGGGGGGGGE